MGLLLIGLFVGHVFFVGLFFDILKMPFLTFCVLLCSICVLLLCSTSVFHINLVWHVAYYCVQHIDFLVTSKSCTHMK